MSKWLNSFIYSLPFKISFIAKITLVYDYPKIYSTEQEENAIDQNGEYDYVQ